jgi:hypothetical protein
VNDVIIPRRKYNDEELSYSDMMCLDESISDHYDDCLEPFDLMKINNFEIIDYIEIIKTLPNGEGLLNHLCLK